MREAHQSQVNGCGIAVWLEPLQRGQSGGFHLDELGHPRCPLTPPAAAEPGGPTVLLLRRILSPLPFEALALVPNE